MAKKVILTDMDDVLNNFCRKWIKAIGDKLGEYRDINDITEWDIGKFYPTISKETLKEIAKSPEFWRSMTMREDALEYIPKLQEYFEVYVVTATNFNVAPVKIEEFLKAFPMIDSKHIILAYNKQLVHGDYIIDDGIHNLVGHNAFKILFDTPHNKIPSEVEESLNLHRVHGWKEVYETIMKIEGIKESEA